MKTLIAIALLLAPPAARAQKSADVHYYNPAWSPDGRSLAFESDRDGAFAIYVVAADGSGLRKLTPKGATDTQPGWSPDGRRLVFTSDENGPGHLWTMDLSGSDRRRLTADSTHRDFYASFSPDGKWIVFGAQDAANRQRYYVDVVASNGSKWQRLTDSTHVSEGPRWTNDGTRIVFSWVPSLPRRPGESGREYGTRVNLERQTVSVRPDGVDRRVGRDADEDLKRVHDPALSRDSRWRADGKIVNGVAGIYVREVSTGKERLVVGGPGSQ